MLNGVLATLFTWDIKRMIREEQKKIIELLSSSDESNVLYLQEKYT